MNRALLLILAALSCGAVQAQVRDDFERIDAWQAAASDGVQARVSGVPGHDGHALRLAYDFRGAGGYAAARRTLPIDFGDNYSISFWARAEAPVNNLEFKLVDASGDNVWWVNRPDIALSRDWQKITFKPRHVAFAWGPAQDHRLRHTDKLELVVSAGRDGGHGVIEFDQLEVAMLPPPTPLPAPLFSASSGASPAPSTGAWTSAGGGEQHVTIDFGGPRELGGLLLHWAAGSQARRYDIDFSDNAIDWRTVRRVADGDGGVDPILLGEAQTRYLRLAMHEGPGAHYALAGIEIKDLGFGASANAFFQALAKEAPRGSYPRGMSGQQNYWTVLGVDGGHETGLFSEDGALEVARGGFSVEPFVMENGQRFSWADVAITQSLRERYLPIPSVTWTAPRWRLRSTAFAHGAADAAALGARYELTNLTSQPLSLRLLLALRPFQVNPPSQFLNTPPGVSPITDIAWHDGAFAVDGKPRVFTLTPPSAAGVSSFDAGGGMAARTVRDDTGFASGSAAYDVVLAPGASQTFELHIPLTGAPPLPAGLQAAEDATASFWRERLNRVGIDVPAAGQALIDTLRSSLAHMLMSRDGAMLRPGTRSYARSWIRDGAMISEAMLRLGDQQVARDYLKRVAPFQFADGKVPCCVDRRGADPVPENDSQGEFIHLAAQLWQFTHDRALLESIWPRVERAAAFMEAQRQSERGAANRAAGRRALFGLLPASISHEGYSAKPMHSYWDDFWGLRGYRDAAMLAAALGKHDKAAQLRAQADQFESELLASLRRSASEHHIDYLPGAAELGDFDATSTTIALSPGGMQNRLPQDLLGGTFERYWTGFAARRDGRKAWDDYTPYELRNVAAFVRLGWRERAHELLTFFMHDRRPLAWNQWAEVVGRDARTPRFVGDMPHGWISSDFIRSTLDLFAYERPDDQSLVLGAGIPRAWLAGSGVAVHGLRTSHGPLNFSMREQGGRTTIEIAGPALPPGGVVLHPELARPGFATVNGKRTPFHRGELRVRTLPATIVIDSPNP